MMEVLKPGLLDLVMDAGRPGFRSQGVPAGGAADLPALIAANRLVGNPDAAAGLEILLQGPVLRFYVSACVGLTGAEIAARVNGLPVMAGAPIELARGDVLETGPVRAGARAYLAVRGGLEVEQILGSRSTFLPGGFGGWQGRALWAGDRLPFGEWDASPPGPAVNAVQSVGKIRILPGPQIADFADTALAALTARPYRVTADANRVGIRLSGAGLGYRGQEMPSQAVLPGAIQVPPDGQPILLGWDGPATGGYPVIAGVIAADLHRLAQLRPGDAIAFEFVTREQALATWQHEMGWLASS